MPGNFEIPRYEKGDALHAATVNQLTDEVRKLNRVRTGGGLSARMGRGGLALGVTFPTVVKVAKNGASAIPAMAGSTPGSGPITLYDMGATALEAGVTGADTAYNLASGTVTANAWIMVAEVDSRWFVIFEACA